MNRLVPAAEILGNQVAEQIRFLNKELEDVRERIREILKHAGVHSYCLTCGRPVVWMWHIDSGRNARYNPDGTIHLCPEKENHGRNATGDHAH
jgi:hypothetical protein